MTPAAVGVGWVVAGTLLGASGLGLCVRSRASVSGVLLAAAGAALVAAGLAPHPSTAGRAGVAAMALLTAGLVTYPRATWDLAGGLALAAALVGSPVLAVTLEGGGPLSVDDLTWVALALAAVGGSHAWWRLETAEAASRGPTLWVLSTCGVTLFLVGVVTLAGRPAGLAPVVDASLGLVGVAAWVGVDPSRSPDGRWLASRAAAWFFSVGCVFAAATLVFTLLDLGGGGPPRVVALALATVVGGMLWNPLLRVVQTLSDRVLFGDRPDALTAAHRVAVGVGDDPVAAVRAIQEGLVLPWAALDLAGEDRIEVGTPLGPRRVFPVDVGDEHIGDLVVGIRPGDLDLSRDDERVITLSLPLVVQTISARSRAASLQRARAASASAREEERRRLRRDLHDGLGPRLTGIAFTADAARLAAAGGGTTSMLDTIRREAEAAIREIRELAYGLRPPALDELGLAGAVIVKAESWPGLRVDTEAADLPALPAAVEVAAYRIVMEALTNVARHSGASRARVVIRAVDGCLDIEVTDDGTPGDGPWVPGIGLTSMRERAGELGGTLSVHPDPAGTTVAARLPLVTGHDATDRDG